jgi:hypothetical protein
MTLRVLVVLLAVSSLASLHAQGPVIAVDLSGLGMGVLTLPEAIETDGDPRTREWLVHRVFSPLFRVVAERPGGLCAGPWFDASGWTVQRLGATDWLTRLHGQVFERQPLLTPVCP